MYDNKFLRLFTPHIAYTAYTTVPYDTSDTLFLLQFWNKHYEYTIIFVCAACTKIPDIDQENKY